MSAFDQEEPKSLDLTRSLRARLQAGVTWNVLASVSLQGSTLLANIIIARLLGKIAFGEFNLIQTTMLSISLVAQLAFGITATKYVAEFRSIDKERSGRIIGLCGTASTIMAGIATLGMLLGSPWLATSALKAPHLSLGLMIGTVFLFFSVNNGYQVGILAGLESYYALAKASLSSACLKVALCSLFAWYGGVNGALAGLGISSLGSFLIHHFYLKAASAREGITAIYREMGRELRMITGFMLPAAINGLVYLPTVWVANFCLVRQMGGFEQFALYSAAFNIRSLVMFLPGNLNTVFFALLNNQRSLGEERRYRKTYWANIGLNGITVLVTGVVLLFLGPLLLGFYGKGFGNAYPILVIMMVSSFIEAIAMAFYQHIKVMGKMWLTLFGNAVPKYATFGILSLILAPKFGGAGLAWAFTCSCCVDLILTLLLLRLLQPGIRMLKRPA